MFYHCLVKDYKKFKTENNLCDVQFIVGSEETQIMAHIAFVAARSKYLRTLILTARNDNQQQMDNVLGISYIENPLEVKLPNAKPEAFEIVLTYIYTDAMESNNDITLMIDVYQLAELFLMPVFANDCRKYLEININELNFLEILIHADKNKIKTVKEICVHFWKTKMKHFDVALSNEYSVLSKPLLWELISKIPERNTQQPTKPVYRCHSLIESSFQSDMASFLETTGKDFSDIDLVLNGHVIKAHKCILSARTQYFQSMFRSFMPPDNKVNISIGDIVPPVEAFEIMLKYIYCADLESYNVYPQCALYLLQANDFYGFSDKEFHNSCNHALANVSYQNALQTIVAADITKNFEVKQRALHALVNGMANNSYLPTSLDLSQELLLEIIQILSSSRRSI